MRRTPAGARLVLLVGLLLSVCLCSCGYEPRDGVEEAAVEGDIRGARVTTWTASPPFGSVCSAGGHVWAIRDGWFFSNTLVRIDPADLEMHVVRENVPWSMRIAGTEHALWVADWRTKGLFKIDTDTMKEVCVDPDYEGSIRVFDGRPWLINHVTGEVVGLDVTTGAREVTVQLPADVVKDSWGAYWVEGNALWVMTGQRQRIVRVSLPDGRVTATVDLHGLFWSEQDEVRLIVGGGAVWLLGRTMHFEPGLWGRAVSMSKIVRLDPDDLHVLAAAELEEPIESPRWFQDRIWAWSRDGPDDGPSNDSIVCIDPETGHVDKRIYVDIEGYGLYNIQSAGFFEHEGELWMETRMSIRRLEVR